MALKNELNNLKAEIVLLPTGLYRMDNQMMEASEVLAQELLQTFPTGVTLSLISQPGLLTKYSAKNFSISPGQGSAAFSITGDKALSIESVREDLSGFSYEVQKHPYENYLEAVMMQLYIDGMALGKKLSGGVWMSSEYAANSASVGQLELMIQLKNDSIYAVSDLLKTYPKDFSMTFSKFVLPPYDRHHSQRIAWLEYRILQIRHKNLLQEIAVMTKVLNADDRAVIEEEIAQVEVLKQSYPVTIV